MKIIVIVEEGIKVSNTLEGVSDYYIVYEDITHLAKEIQNILTHIS